MWRSTEPYAYTYTNANPDADTNANSDAYADAYTNSDAYSDTYTNSDANTVRNHPARGRLQRQLVERCEMAGQQSLEWIH